MSSKNLDSSCFWWPKKPATFVPPRCFAMLRVWWRLPWWTLNLLGRAWWPWPGPRRSKGWQFHCFTMFTLFYVSVISKNGKVRTPTKRKIRLTKKQGLTGYVRISETMYTVYNAKPAKVLGCVVFMLVFFGGQSKSNHWTPWSLNRFGVTGMGNNSNVFFAKGKVQTDRGRGGERFNMAAT